MKKKDIINMMNKEVDSIVPDKMSDKITATSISTRKESAVSQTLQKPRKSFIKTRAFQIMCACLVCVAVLTGILVPVLTQNTPQHGEIMPDGVGSYTGSTYLSMEINPAIDFVVDKANKVKNVLSKNNDADVLLSNGFRESLLGKDIDVAVNMTIDQATRLGYIDASLVPSATSSAVNSVRLIASSDDEAKASAVLDKTKNSAITHLKSKNIFLVVVDKIAPKEEVLGTSGVASIEAWNETFETKDGFHYVDNIVGMDKNDVIETFKRDFVAQHVADELGDVFEDIEDGLDLIGNIKELEDELERIQRENKEGIFDRIENYWECVANYDNITNEEIKDIVDEITDTIREYNETIGEFDSNTVSDISKILKPIDTDSTVKGKINLDKMKLIYDAYVVADLHNKVESLLEDIENNLDKLDSFLDSINNIFGKAIEDIRDVTAGIKAKIDAEIEKVEGKAEEYYNVCKTEIDRTYSKLITKNENNVGSITPEDYDRFMNDILDRYDDLDDFWNDTHKK